MPITVKSRLAETPLFRAEGTSLAKAVEKCMKITITLYGITNT